MKRKLKKVAAAVLTAAVMLVSFGGTSVGAAEGSFDGKKMFYLESLGVFDENYTREEDTVTRAEAAMMSMRLLGMEAGAAQDNVFADVSADTAYSGYIAYAKTMSVMGGSDGYFDPNRSITGHEAVKVLVAALGYNAVALENGGYPSGYLGQASSLGLLKSTGTIDGEPIAANEFYMMLYNALSVKPWVTHDGASYEATEDTVLEQLEDKREVVFVKGVVTANERTALKGYTTTGSGKAGIGNVLVGVGNTNIASHLGEYVLAYVTEEDGKTVHFHVDDKNEVVTIDAEDVSDPSLTKIESRTGTDKETYDINTEASFFYNDKLLTVPTADDLRISGGEITLLDNDGDGTYDVVFITEYQNVVAEMVYEATNTIHFKTPTVYNGESGIILDEDDDDYEWELILPNGTRGTLQDVKEDDVLTISRSKDRKVLRILLSDTKVSGMLEMLDGEGNAVIAGESYKIAENMDGSVWFDTEIGTEATFLIDALGRVVCAGEDTAQELYGYVSKAVAATGFEKAAVQLFSFGAETREEKTSGNTVTVSYKYQNGEAKEYPLASRVNYNGTSISSSTLRQSDLLDHAIGYELNANGEIKTLHTYAAESEAYSLNFNADIKSLGGSSLTDSFLIGAKTTVILVPNHYDNEDDWRQSVKLTDEGSYKVSGINVDEDTAVAECVCVFADMDADTLVPIDADADVSVVMGISEVTDADGVSVKKVHLLTGEQEEWVMTGDNAAANKVVKTLKTGDLVKYSTDAFDRLANVRLIVSATDLDTYYRANANGPNEEVYGVASKVQVKKLSKMRNEYVNIVTLNISGEPSATYELPLEEGPTLYVCDLQEKTVKAGSAYDILGAELVGTANASDVFMYVNNNDVETVVVIKR